MYIKLLPNRALTPVVSSKTGDHTVNAFYISF